MARWNNWSGRLAARPEKLAFVRHEADAQALVAWAASASKTLRVSGAGHSHAPLVGNDEVLVDLRGLSGVSEVSAQQKSAWVWAGSRVYALGRALHEHGLALINQGDIDEQAIAGATATGTHGTGRTLGNLSSAVQAIELVDARGELVTLSASELPEVFQAARLHLGAFGLITRMQLGLRDSEVVQEQSFTSTLDEVLEQAEELIDSNRHFEFFWYPQRDQAVAKTINPTSEAPVYPLAEEGKRCAYTYEVLPNYRPAPHTEMEYSVPLETAVVCMREIAALLRTEFSDVAWPVEFRSLAADDVWLSSAYGRDTVTLSVHQDVALDETDYYAACEKIFLSYGGRPHWGKVHYLNASQLADCHPRWSEWWAARDGFDPTGVFLNDYLAGLRS